ncbi:hypothetical protein [Arenibacter sp. F20364]|uniref:hypothetical protein n=1 Tax=Arenibacter sp. F20364 TaxID=2926415 RepID=UPI001FF0F310|nr:hypothetical protein [Arenibacter sp. F20364]MCK0189966.1 hypothetical protein [Arenibacter sp. F20364]
MHLRLVIYRALLLVIGCCSAQEMEMDTHGEDLFMLSGDWKFHAIYGEGSNYIDIYLPSKRILGIRS